MEALGTIRLELGINAQKMVQQVQLHNGTLESQIATGIELALKDLCEEDNFIETVRSATKVEIHKLVHGAVLRYDVRNAIEKALSQKIGQKIEEYADSVATKMIEGIK